MMNAADVLLYMCSGSDKPASSGLFADTPLQKLQEETL